MVLDQFMTVLSQYGLSSIADVNITAGPSSTPLATVIVTGIQMRVSLSIRFSNTF